MTGKINVGKKVTEHHKVNLVIQKRHSLYRPLTQISPSNTAHPFK